MEALWLGCGANGMKVHEANVNVHVVQILTPSLDMFVVVSQENLILECTFKTSIPVFS